MRAGCFGDDRQPWDVDEVTPVMGDERQIVAECSRCDPEIVVLSGPPTAMTVCRDFRPDLASLDIGEENAIQVKSGSPIEKRSDGMSRTQACAQEFRDRREAECGRQSFDVRTVLRGERVIGGDIDRDVCVEKDVAWHAMRLSWLTCVFHGVEVCQDLLGRSLVWQPATKQVEVHRLRSDEPISPRVLDSLHAPVLSRGLSSLLHTRHAHSLARVVCRARVSRRIRSCPA